ncbi:MAG: DUF1579 family protein [Dehalococcoidia bacterium]
MTILALGVLLSPVDQAASGSPAPRGQGHAILESMAGQWEIAGRVWPEGPHSTPIHDRGTASARWVAGGSTLLLDVKGTQAGQPFAGLGLLSVDTLRKKVVMVWSDNTSGALFRTEGPIVPAGHTLQLLGQSDDPSTGALDRWWRVDIRETSQGFTIEYHDLSRPRDETLMFESRYVRAVGKE